MYVIGDIHGHLETLKNLVDRLDDDYILVGDLVDRGPNSAGVIDFVIHNEVKMVIGNHERMMIDAFNEILENNILVEFVDEINSTKEDMFYFNNMFMRKNPDTEFWLNNGGRNTLLSYITEDCFDLDKFMTHIEYLQKIPYYYIFDNLKKNKRIVYLKNREGIEIGVEENDSISILDMDRVKDTKTFNRMFYLDVDKEKLQFKINYILDVLLINYFGNIDINILELSEHKKNILIDTHFDDLAKSYHELSNLYMAIENNLNLKEEINNLSNETILSLVTVRTDSNIPYDLSMHFLSNFYKENFVRMYAFNKELFYKEYETWNSTKQEMVINFLLNNYVPVRKQIKYRL